jgi:hypothetical protein
LHCSHHTLYSLGLTALSSSNLLYTIVVVCDPWGLYRRVHFESLFFIVAECKVGRSESFTTQVPVTEFSVLLCLFSSMSMKRTLSFVAAVLSQLLVVGWVLQKDWFRIYTIRLCSKTRVIFNHACLTSTIAIYSCSSSRRPSFGV